MKVILVLFVAFSFLFYTVGFQLFFHIQESSHREYVYQTLSQQKIDTIALSAADYHLSAESKSEFSWHGNRYDVVAVIHCGDSLLVECFHDEDEEQIVELFSEFIQLFIKEPCNSGKKCSIAKFQYPDYLPVETQPFVWALPVNTNEVCWTTSNYLIIMPLPVCGPPPQFFV